MKEEERTSAADTSADQSPASDETEDLADYIPNPQEQVAVDLKRALFGGVIATSIAFAASYITGQVSGMEALAMLEGMLPTTRFLSSAVMTGSATILALMLTLLSLSHGAQYELQSVHYKRVRQIALIDSWAFIGATIFLLLLNIPLGGAEKVPASWFSTIYYIVLFVSSLLGGALISVVLMLYNTVRRLIEVIDPQIDDSVLTMRSSRD